MTDALQESLALRRKSLLREDLTLQISEAIALEMDRSGVTVEQLQKMVGEGGPGIKALLNGRAAYTVAELVAVAYALGCRPVFELEDVVEPGVLSAFGEKPGKLAAADWPPSSGSLTLSGEFDAYRERWFDPRLGVGGWVEVDRSSVEHHFSPCDAIATEPVNAEADAKAGEGR